MKISPASRDEFLFLAATELDMIGHGFAQTQSSADGMSALEAWWQWDTHGRRANCRDQELLEKVMRAKASWNLQVKMWAEDVASGLLSQGELVDYCHNLPAWVFTAAIRQAGALLDRAQGFVPRHARHEMVKGSWWPPTLDWFDPVI